MVVSLIDCVGSLGPTQPIGLVSSPVGSLGLTWPVCLVEPRLYLISVEAVRIESDCCYHNSVQFSLVTLVLVVSTSVWLVGSVSHQFSQFILRKCRRVAQWPIRLLLQC